MFRPFRQIEDAKPSFLFCGSLDFDITLEIFNNSKGIPNRLTQLFISVLIMVSASWLGKANASVHLVK